MKDDNLISKNITVVVKEQEPTKGGSVYCEVSLEDPKNNFSMSFGKMYFIRNADMRIVQYQGWMGDSCNFIRQVRELGYKFLT